MHVHARSYVRKCKTTGKVLKGHLASGALEGQNVFDDGHAQSVCFPLIHVSNSLNALELALQSFLLLTQGLW